MAGIFRPALIRIVVFLCAIALFPPSTPALEEGGRITSFPSLRDLDGASFGHSDLKGFSTLLFFFSVYSEGTDKTIEYMDSMNKNFSAAGRFQVVGVNVDPPGENVKSNLRKKKVSFRIVFDESLAASSLMGVKDTPTMILVGPDGGTVLLVHKGFRYAIRETFRARLETVLGNNEKAVSEENRSELDKQYQKKKMISSGALMVAKTPVSEPFLLYVAEDNVLWLYDYEKGKRREMATDVASASWSPGGESIVFANKDKSGIWVKPLNGEAVKISPEGRNPVWSSADDLIAFTAGEDEIWIANIRENKRWRVDAAGKHVEWTPDGVLLIVVDFRNRVWIVSPYSRATLVKKILKK